MFITYQRGRSGRRPNQFVLTRLWYLLLHSCFNPSVPYREGLSCNGQTGYCSETLDSKFWHIIFSPAILYWKGLNISKGFELRLAYCLSTNQCIDYGQINVSIMQLRYQNIAHLALRVTRQCIFYCGNSYSRFGSNLNTITVRILNLH